MRLLCVSVQDGMTFKTLFSLDEQSSCALSVVDNTVFSRFID